MIRKPAALAEDPWVITAVVALALFMDSFLYGLVIPLSPFSGGPAGAPGMLYAAYAVGLLVAAPFCAQVGERYGYRSLMLAGFVLAAGFFGLSALGRPFLALAGGRAMQGAAAAACWTAGLALMAEHHSSQRARLMGLAMTASTAGSVAGPAVSGWLFAAGGRALPFLVAGGLTAADGCLRFLLLPRRRPHPPADPALGPMLLDPAVLLAVSAVVLAAGGWGILEPLLPAHLAHSGMASPAAVGGMFTAATLAYGMVSPAAGWVAERLALHRTIVLGMAGMAATLPLLAAAQGPVGAAAALCLVSVASAFALVPATAALGQAVDRQGRGSYARVYALYNAAYSIGIMGAGALAAFCPELCALSGHCSVGRPAPGSGPPARSRDRPSILFRNPMRRPLLPPRPRLLAALRRGESLPAWCYTDPDLLRREFEAIFRRTWQYVGPSGMLERDGDYLTGSAGDIPVVVVRNAGGLEAFVNICRHRRHPVMAGAGHAGCLRCPYHAWTYDLSGCLRKAPGAEGEPEFRTGDYPLLPVRVDRLGPFVFVNADPAARPVVESHGPLVRAVAETGVDLDRLERHSREEWHCSANWKTMLENYLECYHCAVAHPGFAAVVDVDRERYRLSHDRWLLSQAGQVRSPAAPGLYDAAGPVVQAQYHLAWPNFSVNINPGFPNLSVDLWLPDGPGATRGFSEQYFAPGVDPAWAEALIAFNRQVGAEDDRLTDAVQHSLAAGLPETGRLLLGRERLIIRFQELVAEALATG